MHGATRNQCFALALSLMKTVTPWKTKMYQVEGFEDILRFVQKAPDDIRWTIDKTEFDELVATKKDSAPGPDGIPYGAYRCAGGLGSQFLFDAHRALLDGGAVPDHFDVGRTVFFLTPRPLASMTMEGFFWTT